MKIGINGYEAVISRFGKNTNGLPNRAGSSEYCFSLLQFLYKERGRHEFFIYLPGEKTTDLPAEDKNWHYVIVKQQKLWTLISLSWYFLINNVLLDVFFSPTHYTPLFWRGKLATSIMDLSYLYFPELFSKKDLWQLRLWSYISVRRADLIFTISEFSRNDIINKYHVDDKKIIVTYPGAKIGLVK